jgi:hypothetical protein
VPLYKGIHAENQRLTPANLLAWKKVTWIKAAHAMFIMNNDYG